MRTNCWASVTELGEAISRQATIVGIIWTSEAPLAEEIEDSMLAYVNVLRSLILVSSAATAGAGPTLFDCIRSCVKKILDVSFQIMKESVDSHGTCTQNDHTIPRLAGVVWEACSDLERVPKTNIIAIGRALSKVAVSTKDVLREMNELKTSHTDSTNEVGSSSSIPVEPENVDDDNNDNDSSGADLGNDLSLEEMNVAKTAITFVSDFVQLIKELIRGITALIKVEEREKTRKFIYSLETLLKGCQGIRAEIDELGACLYPPQEVSAMQLSLEKISVAIDIIEIEMDSLNGATEGFIRVCGDLKVSLTRFKAELHRSDTAELEEEMQRMELKN